MFFFLFTVSVAILNIFSGCHCMCSIIKGDRLYAFVKTNGFYLNIRIKSTIKIVLLYLSFGQVWFLGKPNGSIEICTDIKYINIK